MEPKDNLDLLKLDLEKSRLKLDVFKWIIVVVGAIASFWVIDVGRLKLEEFKVTAENERALLNAYLLASETTQPEVWVRKLQVISTLSTNPDLRSWAVGQLSYVRKCSAKESIYQDALRTAAALVHPAGKIESDVVAARQRFEELFWADLPYVGESKEVVDAMVSFRMALIAAESGPASGSDPAVGVNSAMLVLAAALSKDNPQNDPKCTASDKG